jgi:HTH-type transcriptional regulator / antitoxin HigA
MGERHQDLVRIFPLRPIGSEDENEEALAVFGSLGELWREGLLSSDEIDYVRGLAKLIEEYEDSRYPRRPVSGSVMLAHLIEARGISQAQLAADTGIPELTLSELVRGSRPLGRKQIQVLARHFGVDDALFRDG